MGELYDEPQSGSLKLPSVPLNRLYIIVYTIPFPCGISIIYTLDSRAGSLKSGRYIFLKHHCIPILTGMAHDVCKVNELLNA